MSPCPQCKTPVRPGAHFCPGCGLSLATCPKCGGANRVEAMFCLQCGRRLRAECPHCGAKNRAEARFCGACGTLVPAIAIPIVTSSPGVCCPICHHTNRAGARYCLLCGTLLAGAPPYPVPGARPSRFGTGMLPKHTTLHSRYVVKVRIAQGGQGAVYQVGDSRLTGKVWALKEMSESAISPSERQKAVDQFRREAELLARLDHPNLPKVVDSFEEQGKQYMVMEYIDGKTLLGILEDQAGPLEVERVLDWAEQLCSVLSYLHGQTPPIIYRDLKPQNVMEITGTHDVKLIDFGIVRFYTAGKKQDTVLLGTPGYAPPEQYGKGQTDARSDVYALGALLHHLLTNRDPAVEPFRFPSARSLNSAVPMNVDTALNRAVNVRVQDRYQAIDEMSQVLLGKRKRRVASVSRPPAASPGSLAATPAPATAPSGLSGSGPAIASPSRQPASGAAIRGPKPSGSGPAISIPSRAPATLSLSEKDLDFGVVVRGRDPSRSFQVRNGPTLAGKVISQAAWIRVSPQSVTHSGQDVEVTVDTWSAALAPGRFSGRAPNWPAQLDGWVRRAARRGLGAVVVLLVAIPVLLLVAAGVVLAQLAAGLVMAHARRLVPEARSYQGRVEVAADCGTKDLDVKVKFKPGGEAIAWGWMKVCLALLCEIAVIAAAAWLVANSM